MNQKADGRSAKSRLFKETRDKLEEEFADLKQTASVAAYLTQAASLSVECLRLNESIKAGQDDVGSDLIRASNGLMRVLGILRAQRDELKPKVPSTSQEHRKLKPSDELWNGIDSVRYLEEPEVFDLCRISDRVDEAGSVEALTDEQKVNLTQLREKATVRPPRPSDRMWSYVDAYSWRARLTDIERQEFNHLSDLADQLGAIDKLERDQQLRVRAILSRAMLPI
jgi:hypothetical protein